MRLPVLLGLALALAGADTLDLGRRAVIITTTSTGPSALAGPAPAGRAGQFLRDANWDRTLTVGQFLAANSQSARKLGRVAWDGRRTDTRYLSDGTVATDYEFPLAGPLLAAIAPATGYGRLVGRGACPCCGREWPEGQPVPDSVRLVPLAGDAGYSGVLIDARGLAPAAALFPRVVTERDEEVIGPGFASPGFLADSGQFGYYQSQHAAAAALRIGPNPLIVRALHTAGANNCDLVISRADAARVHGSAANLKLLEQCRTGLLID